MRCIRREVEEERLVLVLLDESHRLAKPHVRAVTLKLLELAVPLVGVVEVGVAPVIRGLPHTTAAMPDHVLETPVLRPMRRIVAEMPFPDHPSHITCIRKHIRHRPLIRVQHRPPRTRAIRSRPSRITPRHQRRTSRRAKRADVKVRHANRLRMKSIQIRRPENRIPMATEITVALVVRHDQDDVGFLGGDCHRCGSEKET